MSGVLIVDDPDGLRRPRRGRAGRAHGRDGRVPAARRAPAAGRVGAPRLRRPDRARLPVARRRLPAGRALQRAARAAGPEPARGRDRHRRHRACAGCSRRWPRAPPPIWSAALGLGGDHNTKILLCVVLGGVAFLTADLLTARFTSVPGEERVSAGSAWPVYVTLLSAAALLALADRFEHDGSTGSPWMSAIAFCPLLITRFSFERYAQASSTYRQTIQALSIVPEVAGMSRPGHGERTAVYAATPRRRARHRRRGPRAGRHRGPAAPHRLHLPRRRGGGGARSRSTPGGWRGSARRCCGRPGSCEPVADLVEEVELHVARGRHARRGHRADRQPLRRPRRRGARADAGRARDHLRARRPIRWGVRS